MQYRIKEHSILARLAALKMKTKSAAIVIDSTIYLFGISKEDFLKDTCWLKHELCHIQQFKKYGTFKFLFLYLRESILNGYYNNKYETEARKTEIS